MKRELRFFAAVPGLALVLATVGCDGDVKPVGDVLASDSTLALEVFGAKSDSIQGIGDTLTPVDSSAIPMVASAPPVEAPVSTEPVQRSSDVAVAATPVRRKTVARRASASPARRTVARPAPTPSRRKASRVSSGQSSTSRTSVTQAPRSATTTESSDVDLPRSTSGSIASAPATTTGRGWLVLPAGSELEFEVDQQICSANGSDFNATLAESVVRANGTVIPDGAAARGAIVSLASANSTAAPQLRIESLTFDGNTYAVATRVTRADMKKIRTKSGSSATKVVAGAGIGAAAGGILGRDAKAAVIGAAGGAIAGAIAGRSGGTYARCVPNGGHIVAELTEPLRIPLGD